MTAAEAPASFTGHRAERPGLLGPGWLPAAVGYFLVALALAVTGVPVVDVLVFTGYVSACLVLPGTLLWRFVAGDSPRPFVSDLVFGTCLAYAVELFWYIGVRAAGVPLLVLAWPVLVVGISLLPRWRSRLWRPSAVHRVSSRWAWGMAATVLFAFAFIARNLWWPRPVTGAGLRFPYVDEPYHLGLVSELRHHVPAASPVVDGEPLYYHWFVHAEVAASSWATGIEPVILLQRLSLVPMIVLILMGAAIVAGRLTGSMGLGLLAPVLLTLVGSTSFVPEFGEPFLTGVIYLSPTTTYGQVLLVPILALAVAMLAVGATPSRAQWVAMGVLLAAVSAAKVTVLPFLTAGFLGVVLLALLLRRTLDKRALALFVMSAVTFALVQRIVFGGESRGVRWDPLALSGVFTQQTGITETYAAAGLGVSLVMLGVYLVNYLVYAAGIVGLTRRGAWRDPNAQFLIGAVTAATGATFAFAGNGNAQQYFVRMAPGLFVVAGVWGLSLLLPRPLPERAAYGLVGVALSSLVGAWLIERLQEGEVIGVSARPSVWGLLEPIVLAGTVVGVVVLAVVLVARRRPDWHGMTGAVTVAALLGLGLTSASSLFVDVWQDPVPAAYSSPPERTATIGDGGLAAARWLRGHSSPEDLIATNAHCRTGLVGAGCDNRMFWLAAHAERRVLLEGWSYQSRTAPLARELDLPPCCLPFWEPAVLAANDAAFMADREDVAELRAERDVAWLVVDLRSPHRVERLKRLASVGFARGDYVVLRLARDDS